MEVAEAHIITRLSIACEYDTVIILGTLGLGK
jgi:hypothetical protein